MRVVFFSDVLKGRLISDLLNQYLILTLSIYLLLHHKPHQLITLHSAPASVAPSHVPPLTFSSPYLSSLPVSPSSPYLLLLRCLPYLPSEFDPPILLGVYLFGAKNFTIYATAFRFLMYCLPLLSLFPSNNATLFSSNIIAAWVRRGRLPLLCTPSPTTKATKSSPCILLTRSAIKFFFLLSLLALFLLLSYHRVASNYSAFRPVRPAPFSASYLQ